MRSAGRRASGERTLAAVGSAAMVVFLLATIQARVTPSAWEISSFESVNDLPDWLYFVMWPFMQYGVFVTIPIATLIAWRMRRRHLAVLLLSCGLGIYVMAKVVKRVAGRERPTAFLEFVNEREFFAQGSLGYTSGHAAVAATIATLTMIHLPKAWHRPSIALVGIVGVGRMYVGAHLPLDIIGGVAMGVAAGTFGTLIAARVGRDLRHYRQNEDRDHAFTMDGAATFARERLVPRVTSRHPSDIVRVVIGTSVLLVSLLAVQRDQLTQFETDLFRTVNNLPSALSPVLGPIMQIGNVFASVAVAIVALVALRSRRRAAFDVMLAGSVAWIAAKAVKSLIARPRPAGLVEDVQRFAGTEGLGFVSGHTAVAFAIVTAISPYVPRRLRRALWVVAWSVGAARVFYGAHLPLDVVGGAALGWVVGASLHLLLAAPHRVPTIGEAAQVLRAEGHHVADVEPVGGSPQGSFPFAAFVDGQPTFVKLLDPEPRDRDWIYRAARFVLFRDVRDEATMADSPAQAYREAAMMGLARSHGARVPAVRSIGIRRGRAWLSQQLVESETLASLPIERIDDSLLDDIWRQLDAIRSAGLAHRDLVAENVLVDRAGHAWLVDFAHAITADRHKAMDNDLAELLVSLTLLVGTDRAVSSATRVLGTEALERAVPELEPLVLTSVNRRRIRQRDRLLDELRTVAARAADVELVMPRETPPRPRAALVTLLSLAGLAALVVVAGPSLVLDEVSAAAPRWLGVALLAGVVSLAASAVSILAALGRRLAVGRTMRVYLAEAASELTTGRLSGCDEMVTYLKNAGVSLDEALVALWRRRLLRTTLGAITAIVALSFSVNADFSISTPSDLAPLVALGVVGLAVEILVVRSARHHLHGSADLEPPPVSNQIRFVLATLAELVAGAIATLAIVESVAGGPPLAPVVVVHFIALATTMAAPTQGRLGMPAVVLSGGLAAIGLSSAAAVTAAALVFALWSVVPFLILMLIGPTGAQVSGAWWQRRPLRTNAVAQVSPDEVHEDASGLLTGGS